MSEPKACSRSGLAAAWIVIFGGVVAALHVGKLPPAITALQQALGLSLVQAGFLLSLIQLAGMSAGVAFGALADGLGSKRSMVLGLLMLAAASLSGGSAQGVTSLLVLRACEGFGLLLVVLPAPGLVRRLVPPQRVSAMLGVWGAYMPLATALALLLGPLCIGALGWRVWWWALGGLTLLMAAALAWRLPRESAAAAMALPEGWAQRLRRTLAAPGPWLVAMAFATYSCQWMAVIGFLPTIYQGAGYSGLDTALLTALAAAVNVIGNLTAGRALQRGVPALRLLAIGFVAMGLATVAVFGEGPGGGLSQPLRYAAVLMFSMLGGLVPATLFATAVRVAPSETTLSTTIGWVQQWSALGQFSGPPLVAWVASGVGGWQGTWWVTVACSLAGLWLAARLTKQRAPQGGALDRDNHR